MFCEIDSPDNFLLHALLEMVWNWACGVKRVRLTRSSFNCQSWYLFQTVGRAGILVLLFHAPAGDRHLEGSERWEI